MHSLADLIRLWTTTNTRRRTSAEMAASVRIPAVPIPVSIHPVLARYDVQRIVDAVHRVVLVLPWSSSITLIKLGVLTVLLANAGSLPFVWHCSSSPFISSAAVLTLHPQYASFGLSSLHDSSFSTCAYVHHSGHPASEPGFLPATSRHGVLLA